MEDRSSRRVRTLVTQKARRGLLTQDRISQRQPKPLAPHGRIPPYRTLKEDQVLPQARIAG
jgi:hypothetical protein